MKHVLIVINDLGFLISHRLPIVIAAQKAGYNVSVAYGTLGSAKNADLVLQSVKLHHVPIRRGGTSLLAELRAILLLWVLFVQVRPDLVHLVTIKPVLYGGIAARLARVPAVVSAMSGLGYVFVERKGFKFSVLRRIVVWLFRRALAHPKLALIFQNPNDREQILKISKVPYCQTYLVRGSGIDMSACVALPEPKEVPIVAMASRLLRDKGVSEFIAAARLLHNRGVSVNFWLIGAPDLENPASVTQKEFEFWKSDGVVKCLGHRMDVIYLYSKANIVTLPSYYGEGVPKSLIEAAACGRAVVTTDMPGCRDAIEPNVSGLLVPARDSEALANAIEKLVYDSELRQKMGKAGRALAEREFDIQKVIEAHLQIYDQLVYQSVT